MNVSPIWSMGVAAALSACAVAPPAAPPATVTAAASLPLSWSDIAARPPPGGATRHAYGQAQQQFGQLRLPAGPGPFPLVVLVHGGCWLNEFDLSYFTHLAAALTAAGYATWTLEYRRLGDEGGGWPGTLKDVAAATDHLRQLASLYPLDLQQVVAAGHSAGGQLALWLAARGRLPEGSELYAKDPLLLRGVIGMAAITDLASYRVGPPDSCHAAVDALLGGSPAAQAARYAASSPIELLPLGVPQWLLQGARDPIVSADSVRGYAAAARRAGDRVELRLDPDAGHFEAAMPDTRLGLMIRAALADLLPR